jgi:hypothetical protein
MRTDLIFLARSRNCYATAAAIQNRDVMRKRIGCGMSPGGASRSGGNYDSASLSC